MDEAKEFAVEILTHARKLTNVVSRYIEFFVVIDGVFDTLVYDRRVDRIIALRYSYAKHGGDLLSELWPSTCLSDDVETITLKLPEDWI